MHINKDMSVFNVFDGCEEKFLARQAVKKLIFQRRHLQCNQSLCDYLLH